MKIYNLFGITLVIMCLSSCHTSSNIKNQETVLYDNYLEKYIQKYPEASFLREILYDPVSPFRSHNVYTNGSTKYLWEDYSFYRIKYVRSNEVELIVYDKNRNGGGATITITDKPQPPALITGEYGSQPKTRILLFSTGPKNHTKSDNLTQWELDTFIKYLDYRRHPELHWSYWDIEESFDQNITDVIPVIKFVKHAKGEISNTFTRQTWSESLLLEENGNDSFSIAFESNLPDNPFFVYMDIDGLKHQIDNVEVHGKTIIVHNLALKRLYEEHEPALYMAVMDISNRNAMWNCSFKFTD